VTKIVPGVEILDCIVDVGFGYKIKKKIKNGYEK
jgi:hypothetical protein